jgi:hypothetical protein
MHVQVVAILVIAVRFVKPLAGQDQPHALPSKKSEKVASVVVRPIARDDEKTKILPTLRTQPLH